MGFANFYRKFIASYSTVAYPLTSLTRKGAKFEWTPEAETTFHALKAAFTTAPVLVIYRIVQFRSAKLPRVVGEGVELA